MDPYKMPPVSLGDTVLWLHERGRKDPQAAIVTSVGRETINVSLLVDDQRLLIPKTGARHVTDPGLAKMVQYPGGVWDYTETGRKIRDLLG
jgi:hypothetical protein